MGIFGKNRLTKSELLEVILEQEKAIKRLEQENAFLKDEIDIKHSRISKSSDLQQIADTLTILINVLIKKIDDIDMKELAKDE